MVSRCLVFFLLSADASQYAPKRSHSASIHWRGEVKCISHTRMPQLRRWSKMAGLCKCEIERAVERLIKPGALDEKMEPRQLPGKREREVALRSAQPPRSGGRTDRYPRFSFLEL